MLLEGSRRAAAKRSRAQNVNMHMEYKGEPSSPEKLGPLMASLCDLPRHGKTPELKTFLWGAGGRKEQETL